MEKINEEDEELKFNNDSGESDLLNQIDKRNNIDID
jgi:hypothetical protein